MTRVLAALLNAGVLSALVTVAIWLALRVMPRRGLNAATRYAVWWATLIVAVTLPVLYLPLSPARAAKRAPAQSVLDQADSTLQAAPLGDESVDAAKTAPHITSPAPSHRLLMPVELAAGRWPEWIVSAWIVTVTFMLVRLSASCVALERRKARAFAAPAHLAARAEEWLAHCGSTRRGVRLAVSAEIHAPMMAGLRRPAILIPTRLLEELQESELDQIGLHEAAHLATSRCRIACSDYPFLPLRYLDRFRAVDLPPLWAVP